jgi:thioredoxin-dependent adenylylsulfate APS reductase
MVLAADDLTRFDDSSAEDVLRWAIDEYHPKLAIVTSFQIEGMVLIDLASKIHRDIRVFTIDTGRLPDETYSLIDEVRGRYGLVVEVLFPDMSHVETMVERHGMNLFYRDIALRELCCHVRKVFPLERALERVDAWIAGLRRGQNQNRAKMHKVEIDEMHGGLVKVNPLIDWSRERVWEYVHENKVPYNEMYSKGFTSIGCAPCTRAVAPGEHERAGRWWWEQDETKECGIHGESRTERFEEELAWVTKKR